MSALTISNVYIKRKWQLGHSIAIFLTHCGAYSRISYNTASSTCANERHRGGKKKPKRETQKKSRDES